jgi:hypothetical protein
MTYGRAGLLATMKENTSERGKMFEKSTAFKVRALSLARKSSQRF